MLSRGGVRFLFVCLFVFGMDSVGDDVMETIIII